MMALNARISDAGGAAGSPLRLRATVPAPAKKPAYLKGAASGAARPKIKNVAQIERKPAIKNADTLDRQRTNTALKQTIAKNRAAKALPKTYTDTHDMNWNPNPGGGGDPGGFDAPLPTIDPKTDYLKEAGYIAALSALDTAMANYTSQDNAERGRYDVDYGQGMRDLGYKDDNYFDDKEGAWDWNDLLTASGKGYQGTVNDFAARGMGQSQAYFDGLKLLERSLEDQREGMSTARTNFLAGRNEGLTNYKGQDTAARATAMADAIARLSAQLSLG